MSRLAVRIEGLGKRYRLKRETFWALRDVSLDVTQGEALAMIGHNGAGKSTLLKILARITAPTEGVVGIKGRLAALLEVGTGFHRELTGRENIYLNGSILGMRREEIDRKMEAIVHFAEVGSFLDTPVKHYSSGMYVRLAFAVAAHVEPDVMLIDEVLAVGDLRFQKKCLEKVRNLVREGRTILFVSHNLASVRQLCSAAAWLDRGRLAAVGRSDDVIQQYTRASLAPTGPGHLRDGHGRPGTGDIRVTDFWLESEGGQRSDVVISGQDACFAVEVETQADRRINGLRLSLQLRSGWDMPVLLVHNHMMGHDFGPLAGVGQLRCLIPRFPLAPGTYTLRLQLSLQAGTIVADEVDRATQVQVVEGDFYGTGYVSDGDTPPYLVDARWSTAPASSDPARPYAT